ncbi:hypothetical protein [Chitinimonas lacunae]|uniref:Uncharacterized protein n=1 Tax=Chitinimonas lacunae TaxID=1963018 RepID=A0ABV8MW85_9NEIS
MIEIKRTTDRLAHDGASTRHKDKLSEFHRKTEQGNTQWRRISQKTGVDQE